LQASVSYLTLESYIGRLNISLIALTGKYLTVIANGKKVLANLLSSFDFFDYLCNILLCQSDIDTTIKQ
jgi:hypothetical protein